jgi:UrcA family protein
MFNDIPAATVFGDPAMKLLAALAATFALPALPGAMAQTFVCAGDELAGGNSPAYCSTPSGFTPSGSTKIIKVEREAYGHPPSPGYGTGYANSASSTNVDGYARSQVYTSPKRQPGDHYHDGVASSHARSAPVAPRNQAAKSYGFEWWTSERYYGHQDYPTATTRVHRAAPCGHVAPARTVTATGGGCGAAAYQAPVTTTTTYRSPVTRTTTYRVPARPAQPVYKPAPEPHYEPEYDYTPAVALNRGYCERGIRQLRNDRDGRKRYEVCYRDLQPVYGANVEVLYSRIERAAEEACEVNGVAAIYRSGTRKCERQTIENAVYDTGLEGLRNFHVAATGRGRPRVTVGPLRRY